MFIQMPQQVEKILNVLEANGFEAYIVGGCVRDSVLGKVPDDWDITTNALPFQTIKCFKTYKIVETGLKHGTVTIIIDHKPFEVTTFRIDGKYSDNRRPDDVAFTRNLKEDLSRRDFTINAMAYNPKKGLIDFFGGKNDIQNKIINCVGNPDLRFGEDALRIMRAIRFASVLDFQIENNTSISIHNNKFLLKNIAYERISTELNKLLLGDGVKRILINYVDVISEFIPEIKPVIGFEQNNPHHYLDVWQHSVESIVQCKKELICRLTMLFHDIGKPLCYSEDSQGIGHFYGHPKYSARIAETTLKKLRYDNFTIQRVKDLILYHDCDIKPKRKQLKRLLNKLGKETVKQLFEVKIADTKAHASTCFSRIEDVENSKLVLEQILEQNQCFSLKDLAVKGNDLIAIGVPKGKQIGIILNKLVDMVIDEKVPNDKNKLLDEALKLL